MEAEGIPSNRIADVTLAYGMNRVALEAFAAKLEGRSTAKYLDMIVRLLANYGHKSVRSRSVKCFA
jgi:hypothetical protein